MADLLLLTVGGDTLLRFSDLLAFSGGDADVGTPSETATITAEVCVKGSIGATEGSGTGIGSPVTLAFVAGSTTADGSDYAGVLPDTTPLADQTEYDVEMIIDDGPGRHARAILGAFAAIPRSLVLG